MRENKNKKNKKGLDFDAWLKGKLTKSHFKNKFRDHGVKLQIGIRISELRKKAGFTQVELARKVGVSQGFIAQLEMADTENYEIKTLKKIASAIGMTLIIGFISPTHLHRPKEAIKEFVTC